MDFEEAYRRALYTTTTISVTAIPKTLEIEGQRAWIKFSETWYTALFGALRTTAQLDLVRVDAPTSQWWIHWKHGAIWPDLAGGHVFVTEYQIPPRANIYDRVGAGLAVPNALVSVGVVPDQMHDESAVLAALSQVLGLSGEEIEAAYADLPSNWFIPVGDITGEESLAYDDVLDLPGIVRRERQGRFYPKGGVGAHVVGWVSPIPAEALDIYHKRGYRGDEWVGIVGLEAWGESILRGKNGGRLYLIDAEGNYVRSIAERRPERGRAIYATIDRDLQHSVEQVLRDRVGAIVALDVDTGAILALTSGPTFDNNIFIRATDQAVGWGVSARQTLLTDPEQPLFNRAIQGLYPCGSIFKIVTMAAGLEAGGLTAERAFNCPGYWDGLGEMNRRLCWLETGHGDISLRDGLSASCNIVFYEVGALLDGMEQDILPTYGRAFGLGDFTGLQELQEVAGLMPNPDWKHLTYREAWGMGDTINLSIGQGFLLVTPLQVARMVAAVANGGTLYRPYLVDRIEAPPTTADAQAEEISRPVAQGQLPISDANLAIIREAMLNTTQKPIGTAYGRFDGLPIRVAGKTGTAETLDDLETHAWFAGYFPADDPHIAMVVLAEYGGEGPDVAAPMFRQVLELYYGLR
jgi:penicillin-binding protein 2